jgi:pantoate--beta-alanine ligase
VSETIPCVHTIAEVRQAVREVRALGATVGMVPTMGALHEGHLSLIRTARAECDAVVVSIFVNPTQFGPNEDLAKYPRTLARDTELSQAAGADLIFCPADGEMYPPGFSTWVEVEGLTAGLCGRSRPGHFRGVCTVVTKLLNICAPDRAYFGEKDAQQLAVIRRMVRDLDMPLVVVPCATVREADGLAMSSRNVRLTPEERAQAPALYRALSAAKSMVEGGERDAGTLDGAVRAILREAPLGEVDYVEIVSADSLEPVAVVEGECVIALAVRFDGSGTRLIDNMRIAV